MQKKMFEHLWVFEKYPKKGACLSQLVLQSFEFSHTGDMGTSFAVIVYIDSYDFFTNLYICHVHNV